MKKDQHITIRVSSEFKDRIDNYVKTVGLKHVPPGKMPTRGKVITSILTRHLKALGYE